MLAIVAPLVVPPAVGVELRPAAVLLPVERQVDTARGDPDSHVVVVLEQLDDLRQALSDEVGRI